MNLIIIMNRKIIVLNDCDKALQVKKLSELIYMESHGKKTKTVCCEGNEYFIKRSLNEIAETLPDENFFKIHKSIIINVDFLKSINATAHKTVLLHNNIELNIAHRKYKDFMVFIKTRFDVWS